MHPKTLLFSILLCLTLSIIITTTMADANPNPNPQSAEASVHIVYTEKPEEGQEPELHHIKTLASVLGSEDGAKGAILYSYKHAASGFSAKLTPEQVAEISKQPGVLQVVPSRTAQLHSGHANLHI